ncbi:MAG: hypothetical protein ACXWQO_09695 [Bdellovibrionota bacterium]
MKNVIFALTLALASTTAFASPGSHSLVCKSATNSGSKQKVELNLARVNTYGLAAPTISITVDGKKHVLSTDDEMKMYGETFHNSPLGVITVTGTNENEENAAVRGYFSVVAIPSTVKAYDEKGKRVIWTFKGEQGECYDMAGKAKFKGIVHGYINDGSEPGVELDTQILDCELSYDPGSAC